MRRCTDADVQLVAARPPSSVRGWVRGVLHEVGGLAQASVRWSC